MHFNRGNMKVLLCILSLFALASVSRAQFPMLGTKYDIAQSYLHGKYHVTDTIWSETGDGIMSIAYAPYVIEGISGVLVLNFDGVLGKRYVSSISWIHCEAINSADLTARITKRAQTPFAKFARSMKSDTKREQYKTLFDTLCSSFGPPWNGGATGSTVWLNRNEHKALSIKNGALTISIFRTKTPIDSSKWVGRVTPPK
jgi:hypothetical protein